MKYQLVIKFNASSIKDFDHLIEIENRLIGAFGDLHEVDGHDFGTGEMNIFVHTDSPENAFEIIRKNLTASEIKDVKVAFRELGLEKINVLWPVDYNGKFTIT